MWVGVCDCMWLDGCVVGVVVGCEVGCVCWVKGLGVWLGGEVGYVAGCVLGGGVGCLVGG